MRGNDGRQTESGRWIRRGGRILVLAPDGGAGGATTVRGGSPVGAALQGEFGGPPAYTVCDFIDPRIDVSAQYALFGLLGRGPAARAAALGMLGAVKAGTLAGIYQEDQRAPAMRARQLGTGWWTLIPRGSLSVCVARPPGVPPLISFRKSLASNHFALGTELLRVFPTCGLAPAAAPPPSGRSCTRPPPRSDGGGVPGTGQPVIELSHNRPGWDLPEGSMQSFTHVIDIRNAGGGTLHWQVRTSATWLFVGPPSGKVPAGGTDRLSLTASASGLTVGRYEADVVVSAPGAANTPQFIVAVLRVTPR